MQPHKIVSLQASNVKILKAIEIRPDGNIVVLTGLNGAGKSSILDCVEMALSGADSIPQRPIRDGASNAKIVCDLGDLIVTRTFSATGSAIKVTNAEGVAQKSPQAILDGLVGRLAFDPLEFSRMKPEAQLLTLRKLVGLDTAALDKARQAAYDERTVVNREHDSAKARLALFPLDPAAPVELVDVTELTQKLTLAQQFNQANENTRRLATDSRKAIGTTQASVETAELAIVDAAQEVTRLEALLVTARAEVKTTEAAAESKRKAVTEATRLADEADVKIAALKDEDTAAITGQINSAATVNAKVQANKSHADQKKIVEDKKSKSDALTKQIESVDAEKSAMLAACKFPLEGLSIDGDEVLFSKLPFTQASTAQKLKVSCAIGMALNPNLRVMFVRDGSLLDPAGLEAIAELAEKNAFQIWIEDARSTDPTAIVIEDGQIKG